jgi:CRISPR-associated endoribonuclease Cas6
MRGYHKRSVKHRSDVAEIVAMNRMEPTLYSALIVLQAQHEAALPTTMGTQIHAMFHHLLTQADPALSVHLHQPSARRPFTLSPLQGCTQRGDHFTVEPGQTCSIRVTLLDGGTLWNCLSTLFLETEALSVRIGKASFTVRRLISTPAADPTGWEKRCTFQELVATPVRHTITLSFVSPTAFNMREGYFALVPEPSLVWDNLLRSWNTYAPAAFQVEPKIVRDAARFSMTVTECSVATHTLHFPTSAQKGFLGTCTYQVAEQEEHVGELTRLAAFARFAGVGYKTTMGMGQVRMEDEKMGRGEQTRERVAQVP